MALMPKLMPSSRTKLWNLPANCEQRRRPARDGANIGRNKAQLDETEVPPALTLNHPQHHQPQRPPRAASNRKDYNRRSHCGSVELDAERVVQVHLEMSLLGAMA
jgi:hypothetical protein